jgi:hypothetical protein
LWLFVYYSIIVVIYIIVIIVLIGILNRSRASKESVDVDTEDDDETKPADSSPQSAGKSDTKRVNAKGLSVLRNGVVSMRDLELSADRPTKSRDPDACKLFDTSLTFSKAFQLFSLVHFGKNNPVEKVRDEDARRLLMRCAAKYAMNEVNHVEFFNNPSEQISAFGIGMARNLQQALRYGLYGVTMNFLSEKVFTPRDLYASDAVKKHLGLTGPNDGRCILDM